MRQGTRLRTLLLVAMMLSLTGPLTAQGLPSPAKLAIVAAEIRRAPTARDLGVIRGGLRNSDAEIVRIAVRALGRLERPALGAEIALMLRSPRPEVRAEAANALAQSLQGYANTVPPGGSLPVAARSASADAAIGTALTALAGRLSVEGEVSVRAAIDEAIGRLPYRNADQARRAEAALVLQRAREASIEGRLGVAKGLEALTRISRWVLPPSPERIDALRSLAALSDLGNAPDRGPRVRRLAYEALIAAGTADPVLATQGATDVDAQVRRLAMRAAVLPGVGAASTEVLNRGLTDDVAMVRLEALRAVNARGGREACEAALSGTDDADPHVMLLAIDQLAGCGDSEEAVDELEQTINDLSTVGSPRGWHRGAHAIVSLAAASPAKAVVALPPFAASRVWQIRMYAARAAGILNDRATLAKLAADADDNVAEAALDGLSSVGGHESDAIYVAALARRGQQVVRAAARALGVPPVPEGAAPALKAALQRLNREDRDNSRDVRLEIARALRALGGNVETAPTDRAAALAQSPAAADLRRLGGARARVTIRDVGSFDLALFPSDAPATVARFAGLTQAGYYNGLTFHRVAPNFVVQGGSPGANEYVGDAAFMADEVGRWPHVRGAVGISTRGRDSGDAQLFIDLVDNPRLDHDYTVFGQVLNGIDVVHLILEGDVIERIEIVPGP